MIIERGKGIEEMQNTMKEISEILKDVGIIVTEQGNMLGINFEKKRHSHCCC